MTMLDGDILFSRVGIAKVKIVFVKMLLLQVLILLLVLVLLQQPVEHAPFFVLFLAFERLVVVTITLQSRHRRLGSALALFHLRVMLFCKCVGKRDDCQVG